MPAARSLTIGFTRHIQTRNAFWAIVEHCARQRGRELGATVRRIRQIDPHARVSLLSGYNEEEAIIRFAGKSIAGFLPKPFTLGDLTAKLRQLFEAFEHGTS